MRILRLEPYHLTVVKTLLLSDPIQNLFLLNLLQEHDLHRGIWLGAMENGQLLGVIWLWPQRLVVPWCPDVSLARAFGEALSRVISPCLMIGPRLACDGVWETWNQGTSPRLYYDQRLYISEDAPSSKPLIGFRLAVPHESQEIARYSAAMELEDLGHDPSIADPEGHHIKVAARIRDEKTWVYERNRQIVFMISVGATTNLGIQVGGTYVPPEHRGQGIAAAGMQELRRILHPNHSIVTLHVNERNFPAVRTYERAGFIRHAPFRLIALSSTG